MLLSFLLMGNYKKTEIEERLVNLESLKRSNSKENYCFPLETFSIAYLQYIALLKYYTILQLIQFLNDRMNIRFS